MEKITPELLSTAPVSHRGLPTLRESRNPGSIIKNKENSLRPQNQLNKRVVIEELEKAKRLELKKKIEQRENKVKARLQQKEVTHIQHRYSRGESSSLTTQRNQQVSSIRLGKILPLKTQGQQRSIFGLSTLQLYSPKHSFPVINRQKLLEKEIFGKKNKEVSLIDFGIFTEAKSMDAFLKRFRTAVEHEFEGNVDVLVEDDINRLEFCLLREIHSEGKWLQ